MQNIFYFNENFINKKFLSQKKNIWGENRRFHNKQNSFLQTTTSSEIVFINRFFFSKTLFSLLSDFHKDKSKRQQFKRYKKQLIKYENSLTTNDDIVLSTLETYKFNNELYVKKQTEIGYLNKQKIGRLYTKERSLQHLSNDCRFFLFSSHYFELDIENSFFSILFTYAKKQNIHSKLRVITPYVQNRDLFIRTVIEEKKRTLILKNITSDIEAFNTPGMFHRIKAQIKRIMHIAANREKSFDSFVEENSQTYLGLDNISLAIVKGVQADMALIRKEMQKDTSLEDLKQFVISRKPKNWLISLQNFYAHNIESSVLKIIIEFCDQLQWDYSPLFDGILIHNKDMLTSEEISAFHSETQKKIHDKFPTIKIRQPKMEPKSVELLNLNLNELEKRFFQNFEKFDEEYCENFYSSDDYSSFIQIQKINNLEDRFTAYRNIYAKAIISIIKKTILNLEELHYLFDLDEFKEQF